MSSEMISNSSLANFTEALQQYERATGKDCVVVLNRAALNAGYRGAQFTDIAGRAHIKSLLTRNPKLVARLTELSLKKRGIGKLPKGQFQAEMDAFIARRVGSARYLRSAWARPIVDLGGTFRGSKLQRGDSGSATKANESDLAALLSVITDEPTIKQADSAEGILETAMNKALDFVAEDMVTYAQNKLAQTAAKYSG